MRTISSEASGGSRVEFDRMRRYLDGVDSGQQLREVTATGRYAHRHGERERERERGERGEREAGVPVSKKQGDGSEARRGAGDSRSCLF